MSVCVVKFSEHMCGRVEYHAFHVISSRLTPTCWSEYWPIHAQLPHPFHPLYNTDVQYYIYNSTPPTRSTIVHPHHHTHTHTHTLLFHSFLTLPFFLFYIPPFFSIFPFSPSLSSPPPLSSSFLSLSLSLLFPPLTKYLQPIHYPGCISMAASRQPENTYNSTIHYW